MKSASTWLDVLLVSTGLAVGLQKEERLLVGAWKPSNMPSGCSQAGGEDPRTGRALCPGFRCIFPGSYSNSCVLGACDGLALSLGAQHKDQGLKGYRVTTTTAVS